MTRCPRCAGTLLDHDDAEPCFFEHLEARRRAEADAFFHQLIMYYCYRGPEPPI